MSNKTGGHLNALTGLRFFAAAIVVAFHFARPRQALLANIASHGFVGVTVFFVLSGFILSYTYSHEPSTLKGSRRDFWVARGARLYPVYLVGMALFAPLILFGGHASLSLRLAAGALSMLVVQAWFHPFGLQWGMWNPPGWSLSAEAFFYSVFPFACRRLSRWPVGYLMCFMLGCWLLSLPAAFTYMVTGAAELTFWIFLPIFRLPEFLLGMSAGLLWKYHRTARFDGSAPYLAAASILMLIGLLAAPFNNEVFYNGATAPVAALLICSLACGRGVIAKILASKGLTTLGGASYSLYILHWPLWEICQHLFGQGRLINAMPGVFFALYFGATVAVSCLCFKWIEDPVNIALRKRFMRPIIENDVKHETSLASAGPGRRS